ncbi:membrane protein [Gemmobacter nectariphilus]|uniref:membrane protein n=1 Tax=Gemmobacter nectariphilus TaxID=220343 RepID=UPI0004168386|nr:membrane protein [Gemmobacter nectariphilus]
MTGAVVFDPLLSWPVIWALAGLAALLLVLALWQRMTGALLRALAAVAVLAALANPSWQQEDRTPLSDIVVVVVDDSASQRIADRPAQTEAALQGLLSRIARLPATEARVVRVPDAEGDGGTLAMARLAEALADVPRARLAGAFLISDGQVHDAAQAPDLPAPLHVLLTGQPTDWDRRLVVKTAPAFAIMGEPVSLILRIEDQGAVPPELAGVADLTVTIGAEAPMHFAVPVGEDLELPVNLPHGGINVLQLSVAPQTGELTAVNNTAVLRINGVRDRLRVLLVSGEPHAGERVWRNLLKSDASVDLVHFTILRPPEKQDGVPVTELSLIAFPTRELFVDKVDEFDLIIFDRYRRRGILPMSYLESVRDYVRKGGAVLIAAGPEFGSADSLWRSPLADILPVEPSSRVLEEGFRPALTDLGRKHPVTEGLDAQAPEGGWGRWFRQIDMTATRGQVVMEGIGARPLLVLDREGEGRVAMLASDHIWLWGRGFEGGGPQLELLRRLAHWTMKEPELEEETLTADGQGLELTVTRRTLGDAPGEVTITAPDGTETGLALQETRPGLWQGSWDAPGMGLYRLSQGDKTAVAALGPAAPREFEQTIASPDPMQPVLSATGGGAQRLSDGVPDIRRVAEGRIAAGRGWLGITPREAFLTLDIRIRPLLPPWAFLLLAAGLALAAWLWEGRQPPRKA